MSRVSRLCWRGVSKAKNPNERKRRGRGRRRSISLFRSLLFLRDAHLDRLHHKRHDVRVSLQRPLQGRDVVVGDVLEPGHEGAKPARRLRVGRRRHGSERAAPEVSLGKEDDGLVFGDALDVVAPAAVGGGFDFFIVVSERERVLSGLRKEETEREKK